MIWSEIKQLWDVGLKEYVNDMWNVIDFVTNSLYVATIALRIVAYYKVRRKSNRPIKKKKKTLLEENRKKVSLSLLYMAKLFLPFPNFELGPPIFHLNKGHFEAITVRRASERVCSMGALLPSGPGP